MNRPAPADTEVPRIVIVGAGPAGVRCAEVLVQAGLRPIMLDENARDGGQIYRRPPPGFTRPYAKLYGTEAARAQAVHDTFERLKPQIDYRPRTAVWNVADGMLQLSREEQLEDLPYDKLVLCTGATDRLMPVRGWQRAGTYSLGAAQIALKAQACAIGSRIVFMGSGPLLYLVASQYAQAGANVACVLDTSPPARLIRALPLLLARPDVLWKGLRLLRALRRAGVPVLRGVTVQELEGDDLGGVRAVRYQDAAGKTHSEACDAVGMGHHLRAESQLADLSRCEFRFDTASRQWLPRIDAWGRASVDHVYLAGDGVRLAGADGAELAGTLAALALLKDLGRPIDERRARHCITGLARMERFRRGLLIAFPWPAHHAPALSDDTIVCRCEGITAGELRKVVADGDAREANRAKALSRVGMGRCQGRYCGHAGAEIIAYAGKTPIEAVGRLRGQAPIKPIAMPLPSNSTN